MCLRTLFRPETVTEPEDLRTDSGGQASLVLLVREDSTMSRTDWSQKASVVNRKEPCTHDWSE